MSSLPKSFSLDAYQTAASKLGKAAVKKKIIPFIIGVCGGTASGKTSVCMKIQEEFQKDGKVVLLSQDCFYKNLTAEQKANASQYNFDHPDAIDWEYNEEILAALKEGKDVDVPQYDFKTHSRLTTTDRISGATIIIFEGILIFSFPALLKYMDMKIFVDTDADIRLSRRILRDINERGRDLNGILYQYETFVKPSFETYIQPNKKFADVIIPRGADNLVAINLLIQHIHTKLHELEGATMVPPAPVVTASPIRKPQPKSAAPSPSPSNSEIATNLANKWGPPEQIQSNNC